MRKNNAKEIQEEVFLEVEESTNIMQNKANIVKNNNLANSKIESSVDKERQMFEE